MGNKIDVFPPSSSLPFNEDDPQNKKNDDRLKT
jgi:hypothetical protein